MTTSLDPLSLTHDPVARAVEADRHLWDLGEPHRTRWLAVRDTSVCAAVAGGRSRHEVAAALGMLVSDIDRILDAPYIQI